MKKRIFSLLLLLCSIITGTATAQESGDKERFFPANSIRCTNVITVNFAEMDRTVPKETIYYEMWTGNDTIVDGKPCVTLWQQFDRDITTITNHPHKAFTPELEGVIYEADNGYVYFKYMNDDGNDWKFLYDFSSPNRNEGDTICLGMNDMEETVYEGIDQISTCTLHNGREVQVAEGLMYGIGYQSYPFFFPNYMWVMINAYVPIYDPINFYRNGELLWGVPYDMHSKLAANEQDLDVDGKKWHIRTQVPYIDDRYTNDVFMWIEGDTIVEDIRYKKLYKQTRNVKDSSMGTIEVGYCRQEGDKYYQDGKLMFDFGLGEGDMFATSTENEEAGFFYTVVSIGDTLLLDGLPRKYMVIAPSYEGMIKSNHTDIWVEGIGSLSMGIFENDFYYMAGLRKELQSCSYNGIYIYKKKEESKTYLVTEGKQWAVERYTMGGVQGVYSYCLQGDTIINGKEYKIEHEGCGKDLSGMKPSGRYMREENGRVYSYVHTEHYKDEDEVLFFDFNLEDGDTIVYIPDVYSLHVMDVYDAVVPHSDGQSRKCYEVELWNIREEGVYDSDDFGGTFVEGIGNLCSGLSDPGFGLVGSNQRLLYVKQGDTILYQREEENPKEQSKFFADDTKWYGEEDYVYYSSHHRTSISYSLGTDTVIDGQLGQTLYRDGEYQGTFFVKGESVWFKPSTIFSWFINIWEEEELPTFLLYDFSLQVGDTIFYDERGLGYTYEKTEEYSPNLVVKAVREVHGRKVIDFDDGEQWIEGIGSIREPFFERWRPRLDGPGNTYESIYQVVADSATIWFKGELANPNIEPWLKAGMTWTENKQYNEGEDYVSHQIKLGKGSLPGRFSVSITGMDPWEKPFYELQVFNNKVYGLGMNSIILCYDFSLSVGNKVSLLKSYNYGLDNCYYYYDNCHVTKVDTVVYYGVPRKRIILSGDRDDVWVEGIGSLTRLFPLDNLDAGGDYSIMANYSKVVECSYKGNLLYRKDDLEITRPTIKRGYGLYHSDSYLYRYTIDESKEVTDSTDFARWYDKTVIRIDVDTIGPNAFAGATFRQGQIICFTERLNTIFKDAFTGINILPRSTQDASLADDLTLVFEGNRPPLIDKNQVLDYADNTCRINYAVPDIATYVASDIQWTYTTLMTIEDLLRGQISPENEVTVSDSTEVQVNVDASEDNTNTGGLVVVVEARPRKDIPIRIGDGENKDIYSRAPAWQRYTMELKVTDSRETVLFEDAQECNAEEGCVFEVVLSAYPEDGVVYLHSRSTDMFNRSTEWMVQKASLYRNGEEGYYFTDVNVNLDKHGAEEKLTATITGDSIRITGYYLSNCAGELTCEAYAKTDEIALIFYDEPLANCVGIHYVDFTIPLLTTPVEAIYVVASYDQSVLMEVEILPEGAVGKLGLSGKDAPYYDLTGRRVAHPTRGVYIRNGKKVIL
ncbi:MAG: hypothetical protein IKY84_05560 [Bacteroidaceae bacterium]|nr:hypothetical protein [Bacteroidaceae bacterium]